MYGISKHVDFLIAHNSQIYGGENIIVQTEWPHLIGKVRRFAPTESDEERRLDWLKTKDNSIFVQSKTHRVYVVWCGALNDVSRKKIEEKTGCNSDQYIHNMLERMTEFYVGTFKEGQLHALSWEHRIVPDDYFKIQHKLRKAKAKEISQEQPTNI